MIFLNKFNPQRIFLFLLPALFFLSCQPGLKPGNQARAQVDEIQIHNYGQALFSLDAFSVKKGLDSLKAEYAFFIGYNPDTLQVIQIRDFIMDPFNRELARKSQELYPDMAFLEKGLTEAFSNIKTINPEFRVPTVYTYVSGLLYESPVQYLDSVMIIGLDMFLGWNYEQYREAGLPVFMTRRMEKPNIIPECARQYAFSLFPGDDQPKKLLDLMIWHGKVLYAMDLFLPDTPDTLKIGYTANQMKWCKENEASIWRLLIDQEMLYSSDNFVFNKFIQDGPFTAGLPDGAPAMLGRYLGWQIVKSYMKKHKETGLRQIFQLHDSQEILAKSGYKPRR